MAQIQGQLEIAGREWCDFVCWCKHTEEISITRVLRSASYWDWMFPMLKDFYTCTVADIAPAHLTSPPQIPPPVVVSEKIYEGSIHAYAEGDVSSREVGKGWGGNGQCKPVTDQCQGDTLKAAEGDQPVLEIWQGILGYTSDDSD
mmetsp:Transcript_650/g.1073  ORF Transcript_650/g.1073 Transcript_650/m.1073 type:complete len:145 (+) Transcript_650:433-867(+)